jgi:Tfp pilus assembly protein PilZ
MKENMEAMKSMTRLLPLLREFSELERRRIQQGVTPVEYQRWLDLSALLQKHVNRSAPEGGAQRRHIRVPTRMLVEFRSRDALRQAIISSISRGGLYIDTPAVHGVGEIFTLCIRVSATGERVDVPCEVVSSDVDSGMASGASGMGVKFGVLSAEQRRAVDEIFAAALGEKEAEAFFSG